MQLPTSLALSFLQLADRRGNGDSKVSAQELAAITIAYSDERQKQVTAGNTQLAQSYEPYIQLGTTAFFGGKDHKGLVPDFNGDKLIDLQTEAIRLDADKNGSIDSKDYQANFGASIATGANPVTSADIESLRQIALGQQFVSTASPIGATPPVTGTPPVPGTPPVTGTPPVPGMPPAYGANMSTMDPQMLMMTMGLVMMATMMMGGGMGGQLPGTPGATATPGMATTPGAAPTNGLPPTPGSMPTVANGVAPHPGSTTPGTGAQTQPGIQQLLPMLLMALMKAFGMDTSTLPAASLPTAGTAPKSTMASTIAQQNFANQASQYAG